MSMQNPIADMLTRIRNGQQVKHKQTTMPHSNQKEAIAKVLKEEGYIISYEVEIISNFKMLVIYLKYHDGKSVIDNVFKISRPGLRVYKNYEYFKHLKIPGFGIQIVSTSSGIMSHNTAKSKKIGGEVICQVA